MNKLSVRLFLGIYIVLLISFGITGYVVYNLFNAQSLANFKEYLGASASQTILNSDLSLKQIKELSMDLYFDYTIQRQLERDYMGVPSTYDDRMNTLKEIDSFARSVPHVLVVYIYGVKDTLYFSSGPPAYAMNMKELAMQPWFPLVEGSGGNFVFVPDARDYVWNRQDDVMVVAREIFSDDFERVLGYQIIAVDLAFLRNDLERSLFSAYGAVVVREPGGADVIAYLPDETASGGAELIRLFQNLVANPPASIGTDTVIEIVDRRYIFVGSRFVHTGFQLYGIIPVANVTAGFKEKGFSVLAALGVGFVFALLFTYFFSRTISRPFLHLSRAIRSVQTGLTYQRMPRFSLHEADRIGQQFNAMVDNLEVAISRNHDLQFRILLSQINPHFLQNTLYSIYWMVKLDQDRDVTAAMLSSLSKLLQYGLDDQRVHVRMAEEIEYLENYIFIQKQRFKDKLHVEIEADDELLAMPVQKLLLQPIIENCIQHGSVGRERVHVTLKGTVLEDGVRIEIADDGCGIPPDRLKEIQARLADLAADGASGIGLINVHQRIQLAYGFDYGLAIESGGAGQGTVVTIRLPKPDPKT